MSAGPDAPLSARAVARLLDADPGAVVIGGQALDATKQNISLHLKNLFDDGELAPAATVKESLTVQIPQAAPKQWRRCHG